FFAVDIQGFYLHTAVAGDFAVHVSYTQAALEIFYDFTLELDDIGVDVDGEGMVFLVVVIITDDHDLIRLIDLHGCQGYADFVGTALLPVDSSVLHVLHDLADLVGDDAY